jgi:hypothetical protein
VVAFGIVSALAVVLGRACVLGSLVRGMRQMEPRFCTVRGTTLSVLFTTHLIFLVTNEVEALNP